MEKKKILCYHTSVKITLMRDPIVPNRKGKNSMEQFFKLKEHGTDVKTELAAGLTTFMTMAYNPAWTQVRSLQRRHWLLQLPLS